jgi:hypothetical protein
MPMGRHSKGRAAKDPGLSRRRFLRAAGVGTAGAMVAAGAVAGQAGAEVAGAAVPGAAALNIPARRKVVRAGGQQAAGVAVLAVSGPLSFHTITPQRYLDTRFDGGGPFPPQGSIGEFFIFDFGNPDYFAGAANEVPPEAKALACNLTVTSGTSGGNLRAFPGNSDVIPLVSNLNWTTGQTVANYAIVAAATPADGAEFQASIGLHNASTRGSVHVIVDISGYFL